MNGVRPFGSESGAYQSGASDARRASDHAARVAAFGAIRRAAEIKRHHEGWDTDAALAVDTAIRAAIGSPKA